MPLRVLPSRRIRADATALIALVGAEPLRAVSWDSTAGAVEPLGAHTDGSGRAFALYTPVGAGQATITVTYGDSGA